MGTLKQLEDRIKRLEELRNIGNDERTLNLNLLLSSIRQKDSKINELMGMLTGLSQYIQQKGLEKDYMNWIDKAVSEQIPKKGTIITKESKELPSSDVKAEPVCIYCDGRGYDVETDGDRTIKIPCPACKGTGKAPKENITNAATRPKGPPPESGPDREPDKA